MYARILNLTLADGRKRADAEAMADQTYPIYKSLKGFVGATFLVHDESKRQYGSVTLWETREDAEAAGAKVLTTFMDQHAGKLAGPPDVHIAEIYEPK